MNYKQIIIYLFLCCAFLYSFDINGDGRDGIEKLRNEKITQQELLQHIKYLSSDELEGRFPGTTGDSLTNSYIANEFIKYNLKPLGDSYYQPFEMYTGVKLDGSNSLSVTSSGNSNSYSVENDFIPLGFSGKGSVEGDLVFVGYGITAPEQSYDDYKDRKGLDIDIKGKILVMMRYSPGGSDAHNNPFQKYEPSRYKTLNAREGEAAGIIIINGPDGGEDNLSRLAYDNALQDAGLPVVHVKREIIEKIFQNNGYDLTSVQKEIDSTKAPYSFPLKDATAKIEVNISPVRAETNNVIAFLEGNDPVLKNEVIIIGAHKDHVGYGAYGSLYNGKDKQIHNGADDNASGTAGLLEIAQKLSAQRKDLKRSVLFMAFGAEEAGLLGSAFFTKSKEFQDMNVAAMLNMDMIGRMADNKLIIYGTGTSPVWDKLIDSLNMNYNFSITKTPDGFGPSDHSSFYTKNIPVLHFFSGTHSDYHSPTDDVEKINISDEEKIANLVLDVAMVIDDADAKPEFTKVVTSNNETKSMGNIKVYVGTIPDYSSTVEGMKLAGVKEGSPAEKGGLIAEDIIIKFGKKDVKNIYDYMYAMAEFKPGEEAEVVVLRKNEPVTLKITLGSR